MNIVKISSNDINGKSAQTRVGMLLIFIQGHDLDIVFLLEMINLAILNITMYATHLIIGETMRHIYETRLSSLQRHLTTVGTGYYRGSQRASSC